MLQVQQTRAIDHLFKSLTILLNVKQWQNNVICTYIHMYVFEQRDRVGDLLLVFFLYVSKTDFESF